MTLFDKDAFIAVNTAPPPADQGKVACIGSGPASLACAVSLRMKGYDVTVFEALPKAGGTLTYTVPEHKMPQKDVDELILRIKDMGIKFVLNTPFNKDFNVKKLSKEGMLAVFLGLGLWGEKKATFSGFDLEGVFDSTTFLALTKHGGMTINPTDKIVIIGGGNSGIQCAITAKLKKARSVTVLSRYGFDDFSADREETAYAFSIGVEIIYDVEPRKIIGKNGKVIGVRARSKNGLSEITREASKTVIAIGKTFAKPNAGCALMLSNNKLIETNNFMTAKDGFFSGGNAVRGNATVQEAILDGKNAAEQMDLYIKSKQI